MSNLQFEPPTNVTERSINIIVADDEGWMIRYYTESLTKLGHKIIGIARNGKELVELVHKQKPDLVITDIKMPVMDGLDAAQRIYEDDLIPVIIVSGFHDNQTIISAENRHISSYLIKPVRLVDLKIAITLAMDRAKEFGILRSEGGADAWNDKKVIDKAKSLLMARSQVEEPAAIQKIQTIAAQNKQKLVDVARTILMLEEAH